MKALSHSVKRASLKLNHNERVNLDDGSGIITLRNWVSFDQPRVLIDQFHLKCKKHLLPTCLSGLKFSHFDSHNTALVWDRCSMSKASYLDRYEEHLNPCTESWEFTHTIVIVIRNSEKFYWWMDGWMENLVSQLGVLIMLKCDFTCNYELANRSKCSVWTKFDHWE